MKSKILILLFALLAVACEVRSQANLSVQGSIQNSSGIALADGKYSVVFRLYESESGGTPVWSETHPELEVSGGLYSAALGLITPLTASFDKPYFLGVSVGDSPELYPRARLSSSPYALSLVGKFKPAREFALRAVEQGPENPNALYTLGMAELGPPKLGASRSGVTPWPMPSAASSSRRLPLPKIAARSKTATSSRTFPGQR